MIMGFGFPRYLYQHFCCPFSLGTLGFTHGSHRLQLGGLPEFERLTKPELFPQLLKAICINIDIYIYIQILKEWKEILDFTQQTGFHPFHSLVKMYHHQMMHPDPNPLRKNP